VPEAIKQMSSYQPSAISGQSSAPEPDFLAAARAADQAADAQTREEEMRAVFAVLQHKEAIQIALTNHAIKSLGGPPPGAERLPLRDGNDDYGEVVARVPEALYFGLLQQRNFGPEGFECDEGLRDLHDSMPFTRVKTVSGRASISMYVPHTDQRSVPGRVHFGPGTLVIK
jgi:hypothetical protein